MASSRAAEGLLPGEAVDVSELSDHALAGKGIGAPYLLEDATAAPSEQEAIDRRERRVAQVMTWLPPAEFAAGAGRWTL